MKTINIAHFIAGAFCATALSSYAANSPKLDERLSKVKASISAAWQKARPGIVISEIETTAIDDVYRISVGGSNNIYSSGDGKHFVVGDLFRVDENKITNVSEERRNGDRAEALAEINDKDLLLFPAKAKKTRLYVFTDVDCYYCQKLHHNMDAMNALGIEVAYLGFPRAGINSDSHKKIASAWCADNRQQAMTQLKNREKITENFCPENPIADQFNIGRELGISATPALVTEDGELISGYLEPEVLAQRLGL